MFQVFFFKEKFRFCNKISCVIVYLNEFLKKKSRDHEYQIGGGHFIGKPSSFFAKGSKESDLYLVIETSNEIVFSS